MAHGPAYVVKFRRRREQKTDYQRRLALLKSGKPRLVMRKSNRHIQVQLVAYQASGDLVLASAHSNELSGHGWKHAKNNVPAAYLTGWLAGCKIGGDISETVLDTGLQKVQSGGRLYAALKGALDAGLSIPHSEDIFPNENRIEGKHISPEGDIAKDIASVKAAIQKKNKC